MDMTIPYEIGQKVFILSFGTVKEITIEAVTVSSDHIRIHSSSDYWYSTAVYNTRQEAVDALREDAIKRFRNEMEYIAKMESEDN